MSHLRHDAPSVAAQPPVYSCASRAAGLNATWISLGGELDLAGVPQLGEHLSAAIAGSQLIVLDLRRLTFMDGAGVHAILDATIHAGQHRTRLVLVRGPVNVDAVFAYTNTLDQVEFIDMHTTEHALVKALLRTSPLGHSARPSP